MKSKHTPLPWEWHGVMNGDELLIIRAGLKEPELTSAMNGHGPDFICSVKLPHVGMVEAQKGSEAGDNAAFIVRAVNAHEALVKALQAVMYTLRAETEEYDLLDSYKGALAALKAAGEKA